MAIAVGEEDGDFGVEALVEGPSHKLNPFIVSCFHHSALVVELDEDPLPVENVAVFSFVEQVRSRGLAS